MDPRTSTHIPYEFQSNFIVFQNLLYILFI